MVRDHRLITRRIPYVVPVLFDSRFNVSFCLSNIRLITILTINFIDYFRIPVSVQFVFALFYYEIQLFRDRIYNVYKILYYSFYVAANPPHKWNDQNLI